MKPSDVQLDILPAAASEERPAAGERKVTRQAVAAHAVAALAATKERIREREQEAAAQRRPSLRGWAGGSSKAGSGFQTGTATVLDALPAERLAALYAAPECGCGSHTGRECPDCGVLYCDGQGHPRHVCVDAAHCLRCDGSGRLAHVRGVSWPVWLRRVERDPRGELVAGFVRFPPSPEAVAAVAAAKVPCRRCGGTGAVTP